MAYVLPLDSDLAELSNAGGKGSNLARLARAGFPVPGGFLLTTAAYRLFVSANQLEPVIQAQLEGLPAQDAAALEGASGRIRALFSAGALPEELAGALAAAYAHLGAGAVAVRSSATAEDLPDLSFAGQQDTFLNITSLEGLREAVVNCWSSLWTARAIGYRARNRIHGADLALAVVVQSMVESRASGVMFTANPLSGLRSETVIDAALGLGEGLVSGQVEPDHYVVDARTGEITQKTLGAKALAVVYSPGGGTRTQPGDNRALQALSDDQIVELARLGQRVQEEYEFPQDIEWAEAGGKLYLLQSRAITSLFPLPAGMPAEPLKVMFSFGAVQGLLDPITPIGQHTMQLVVASMARLYAMRVSANTQTALYTAGERLWANFTPLLRNTVGRDFIHYAMALVEPTIGQAIQQILDDPRLKPARRGMTLAGRVTIGRFVLPLAANVLMNLTAPVARRVSIVAGGEHVLAELRKKSAQIQGDRYQKLAQRALLLDTIFEQHLLRTFLRFVSCVAAGMVSWNMLNLLTRKIPVERFLHLGKTRQDLLMEVTRGMPYNPTTEMDLALWAMARVIRADAPSWQAAMAPAEELAARYLAGALPQVLQVAVAGFLEKYGGRGLGEIDLGRARWADHPAHVFEMLASFLRIEDAGQAPDVVFARGEQAALRAIDALVEAARGTRWGWLRARLLRFFAGRARNLMGARESPKFFVVRMLASVRSELIQSGREWVQAGELREADDLVYLTFDEIGALARREQRDWTALIAARRANLERERGRRQIPRLLLSDGRAFYEGIVNEDTGEGVVVGNPVSPGQVEGLVRVVLDPRQANLHPGEIMVCPGTDPSWTPLFLTAGGLVMEVGGMMTHGAVVAREYGIPAIVGVDRATTRLITGQRIRIDGSSGKIVLLETDAGQPAG